MRIEEGFIFTQYKESEGNFGIGKVPQDIEADTQKLHQLFYNEIPADKLNAKTYHQWFQDFNPDIKKIVEKIQDNKIWQELCITGKKCSVLNLHEMDELYYSKAPKSFDKRDDLFLYGATGNYDAHVDGVFNFPGMHFYRVLIGLTPGNKKVETNFLKLDVTHKLQENDYIVFDFDKAQHQVVNKDTSDKADDNYRIMLKLHFLVCEDCSKDSFYMKSVKQSYIAYEYVTRYVMKTGTDPTTPYEFLIGIICMIGNNYKIILFLFMFLFFALPISYVFPSNKRNNIWKSRILYANIGWLSVLFATTISLWLRYIITGKR
jgi:hypothetical protein